MVADGTRHETDHRVYGIAFPETAQFKDTYGGVGGLVFLESHRIVPSDVSSDTVVLFMHPIGGGAFLPFVQALARAGVHVIYCNSRYRGNDSALIMEKVVIDMGEAIKDAKRRFGYERVVLAGWSGGGSLSLFYQQQARCPSVTATPAGDGPDLTKLELAPADGMMLVAAHPSRHRVLVDSMDPSITDEQHPDRRDVELDLYDPRGPQAPYDAALLERFRAAQRARNRRITAWVEDQLEALRAAGRPDDERGFVVRGTMADPRWLDPSIDPNQRTPGVSFLGDPQIANEGPVGLARFCTLRSWLSQWGIDRARGDGITAARDVGVPTLVVCNGADEICTPGYASELFEAVGHDDRTFIQIDGANHYYLGQEQIPKVRESAARCVEWLGERGLA